MIRYTTKSGYNTWQVFEYTHDEKYPTEDVAEKLLVKYDLLVKDLKSKVGGNYLRIAIRNRKDNEVLLNALRCELR